MKPAFLLDWEGPLVSGAPLRVTATDSRAQRGIHTQRDRAAKLARVPPCVRRRRGSGAKGYCEVDGILIDRATALGAEAMLEWGGACAARDTFKAAAVERARENEQ